MSNTTLGLYDPLFYAQEALIQLEASLGMASRVHRDLDRTPQSVGSTIMIRRPTSFVATDMPSAASALNPDQVSLVLDKWKGVTFQLTDKELTYTRDRIIIEHIRPAAVAIAVAVDQSLTALYKRVPWFKTATSTPTDVSDITALWQQLFDNKVPADGNWHLMLNGERTSKFLNLAAFSQWQGAGAAGVTTQQNASLGTKFDFEIFSNQLVPAHTTTALGSVTQLQLNAGAAAGATTIVVKDSDGTLTGTIAEGDTLVIAGSTQRYVVTALSTAGSNLFTLTISPGLAVAGSTNDNVTLQQSNGKYMNLAFHRDAFALAMAPLSDLGNGRGAQIESVTDPITNLSLRSRLWYDGTNATLNIGLDALWGVTTLNGNMAVRYES